MDTNKVWRVVTCLAWCSTETFKFSGDTLLGGQLYNKLYSTHDSLMTNWSLEAVIREDSSGKIYTRYQANDTLMYDFNLNINDTARGISPSGCFYQYYVNLVDSVTLLNGEKRKRILFSNGEQWIEGIGSLTGIIYPNLCITDIGVILNCFHENDTLKFGPHYSDCYYNAVGINEISNSIKTTVKPNPVIGLATIQLEKNINSWNWELYNSLGQVVDKKENLSGDRMTINGTAFENGIYHYKIEKNSEILSIGKIIIYKKE